MNDEEVLPYLMCVDKSDITPLTKAIEDKDIIITTNLFELLIKGDEKGLLYAKNTFKHLLELK